MEKTNLEKKIFSENMSFARNSVNYNKPKKSNGSRKYTVEQVIKALDNPVRNYKILQETSLYLLSNSMTYKRLLSNFSNMVNYDFMLKPTLALVLRNNKNNLLKYYYDSANVVEKVNTKNFRWMGQALWEVGELYLFEIEGDNGIIYKRMPEEICRISSVVDNAICKYSIDLSRLSNADLLATMPREIQDIYSKYTKKQIKEDLLVEGKWYELNDNAIAFNAIDPFMVKGYPLLAPIFPSLLALEEQNRKITSDEEVDNLKIIHMEYEVDEEGNSVIDPKLIEIFHQSVKDNLPEQCCVATNPLKMSVHTTKNSQQSINYRKETGDIVYSSVGSSRELFNGERNSNLAIDASIKSDEIFALMVANQFENYLNYKLKSKKKTSYWITKLLPTTYYNANEYKRQCETSLSFSGNGNQLRYLASCGYSPLEAMALLQVEKDLGINELFNPALNAYNSSSSDITTENGRPSSSDIGEIAENEGE